MKKELPSIDHSGGRPNWQLAQRIFDNAKVGVSFGDVDDASEMITEAITQQTAELQRENEQERQGILKLQAELETATKYKDEAYQRANKYRDKLTEAQSHIVALREAWERVQVEPYGCPFCDSGILRKPDDPTKDHNSDCGYFMMREAYKSTKEAGERIRREWREATIDECIATINKDYFHLVATGTMEEALQTLKEGE